MRIKNASLNVQKCTILFKTKKTNSDCFRSLYCEHAIVIDFISKSLCILELYSAIVHVWSLTESRRKIFRWRDITAIHGFPTAGSESTKPSTKCK